MSDKIAKQNIKKPLKYKWILIWYLVALLWFIFSSIYINYEGKITLVWANFIGTLPILYIIIFLVKFIRNRQLKIKNLKIPLFVGMFILPLFVFCVFWNFASLGVYAPNCFKTGRHTCLDWRLDLLLTLPLQVTISFFNTIFLTLKKHYLIWVNTFFLFMLLIYFLVSKGLESLFISENVLQYYLFALTGLIDIIFYLFYFFKKTNPKIS